MSHAKQLHHRRYLNDYFEIINHEGLPGNVKHDLCLEGQDVVITTLQQAIKAAWEEELRTSRAGSTIHPGPRVVPRSGSAVSVIRANCGLTPVRLPTCACPNCAGATAT